MPKDQNNQKEWRVRITSKDKTPIIVCAEFRTDNHRKLEIIEKNGKKVKIAKELLDGTIKIYRNKQEKNKDIREN